MTKQKKITQKSRTSRYTIIALIAMICILPVVAALQYVWLGQLSAAEKVRMQSLLRIGTQRFSEDFDTHMTQLSLAFSFPDGITDNRRPELLAESYNNWKNTTIYPGLIEKIYFIPGSGLSIFLLDTISSTLRETPWPAGLEYIRNTYGKGTTQTAFLRLMPLTQGPFLGPTSFIILPAIGEGLLTIDSEDETFPGYIVAVLNNTIIRDRLIADLIPKHFATGGEVDYELAIATRDSFYYRTNKNLDMAFFRNADAIEDIGKWRSKKLIIATAEFNMVRDAPRELKTEINESRISMKVLKKDGADTAEITRFLVSHVPDWQVLVRHRAGSLEEVVSAARNRNLAVGYLVLLILGSAMVLALYSARRMQRLAEQQMEFVAGVTHELRTPLAVIRSAAENIADGVVHDQNKMRAYGRMIRDEGRRLSDNVERTLDFAGIQSGKEVYSKEIVNLYQLLISVVESHNQSEESAGARISLSLTGDELNIIADRSGLRSVFDNLINNAIKYSDVPADVDIKMDSASMPGSVKVVITDRGEGVPARELVHIFEPFYRGSNIINTRRQGSGLGLSVVQHIINAHNGEIFAESDPQHGSTFTVILPAARGDQQV